MVSLLITGNLGHRPYLRPSPDRFHPTYFILIKYVPDGNFNVCGLYLMELIHVVPMVMRPSGKWLGLAKSFN